MFNLLKAKTGWTLASGVEINPDGSGFLLTRLTDVFNFETDEGITWEDDGINEAWGDNAGTIRSANDAIELVGARQNEETRAYKTGFNVPADFKLEFKMMATGVQGCLSWVGLADNTKFPTDMAGDGVSNILGATFRYSGPSDARADSYKNGVRNQGTSGSYTARTSIYVKIERVGTTLNVVLYSDKARTVVVRSLTEGDVSIATLTNLIFIMMNKSGSQLGYALFWNFELWNNVATRYPTTSPVASMGFVSLSVGTIISGVGALPVNLPSGTSIGAAYRVNNGAWSATFATVDLMNADLLANPVTITDAVNSFDMRLTFNTSGDSTPEIFIVEGPTLEFLSVCDFPAESDVRFDVDYDNGDLTGTYNPERYFLPLELIEVDDLEVIKL